VDVVGGEAAVRRAVISDAGQLAALRRQMFLDMGAAGSGDGAWLERATAWFAGAAEDPDVCVMVAELDGRLVASAMGEARRGAPAPGNPSGITVHLSNVVTLPLARRRGLARQCLTAVLTWAQQELGVTRIQLNATPDGRRLYEQLGFLPSSHPGMTLIIPQDS